MDWPRQKPTFEGGGKKIVKDGSQVGSCGELKLQTKAYLQITEPRGWKRNPLCVIVSHVLPCPVIFSRLRLLLALTLTMDLSFTGENQRNHRMGIAFSTECEIMWSLGSDAKLENYLTFFKGQFYREPKSA